MDKDNKKNAAAAANFLQKVVSFKRKLNQQGTLLVCPDKSDCSSSSGPPQKIQRDGDMKCCASQTVGTMTPDNSVETKSDEVLKAMLDVFAYTTTTGKPNTDTQNRKPRLNNGQVIQIDDSDDDTYAPVYINNDKLKTKVEEAVKMDTAVNPMGVVRNPEPVGAWLRQIGSEEERELIEINSQLRTINSETNVNGSLEIAMLREKQLEEKDQEIQDLKSKIESFELIMTGITQKYQEEVNYLKLELMRKEKEVSLLWTELDLKVHAIQKMHTELSAGKRDSYKLRTECLEKHVEAEKLRMTLVKKDMAFQNLLETGLKQSQEIRKLNIDIEKLKEETINNEKPDKQKMEVNAPQQTEITYNFQQIEMKTEEEVSGRVTPIRRLVPREKNNPGYIVNPVAVSDSDIDGRETPVLRNNNIRVKQEFSMQPDVVCDVHGERPATYLELHFRPNTVNSVCCLECGGKVVNPVDYGGQAVKPELKPDKSETRVTQHSKIC